MKKEIEIRSLRLKSAPELREEGEEKRVVGGIGIPYNEFEGDPEFFLERFMPGSFKNFSIEKNRDVTALYNHDRSNILGRLSNNTLRLMDTEEALMYEVDVPKTSYGNDFLENVRLKNVDGASIGFIPERETWEEREDGVLLRTITEATLTQVSPEATPWYSNTSASLRSIESVYNKKKEELQESRSKEVEKEDDSWKTSIAKKKLDLKTKYSGR